MGVSDEPVNPSASTATVSDSSYGHITGAGGERGMQVRVKISV